MAEGQVQDVDDHIEIEDTPGYKAPAEKSVKEILEADKNDDSLQKYKAALLGDSIPKTKPFPQNEKNVIVKKMAIVVEGREDMEFTLCDQDGNPNPETTKNPTIVMKEGTRYRIKIVFVVQSEIVAGLKYIHKVKRKGITVDKDTMMVGSYGPKESDQSYQTPWDDAPSGMIARGVYAIDSLFTDDDKNEHLKWKWNLEIKKDWA